MTKTTSCYLTLTADYSMSGNVLKVRATRITQNAPATLDHDQVAVRLNLSVPESLFAAHATVGITIPEDAVAVHPVTAEVETEDQTHD